MQKVKAGLVSRESTNNPKIKVNKEGRMTNNLEAIELLRSVKFSDYETSKKIVAAIELLQADEDIEVKEKPTCKNCDAISIDWFMSRAAYTGIAPKCNDHKKPTKETKLRDFKKAFKSGERDVYPHRYEIVELLNILLEEES